MLVALFQLIALPAHASAACPPSGESYPRFHADAELFERAIEAETGYQPAEDRLTGITVPHHLVAADLIARGIRAAEAFDYDRVILLSPDHFRQVDRGFATTPHGFETVMGPVAVDKASVNALISGGVDVSCLFAEEHGINAILPFLAARLPHVPIVPVAISTRSSRPEWDRLVDLLTPLAGERTLVVQSTDFSHYLPGEAARRHDQQVLNLLAANDLDQLAELKQPDHLDSLGAAYVQMKLQAMVYGATPVAIASVNQEAYAGRRLDETTGYIVLAFGQFAGRSTHGLAGGDIVYLGGDAHFARAMTRALADADAAERVVDAVRQRTGGFPLVVNLEGVILPNVPEGMPHMTLAMPRDMTVDMLTRMGVVATGLANNHAGDLGDAGRAETAAALDAAGIRRFGQGERIDLGRLAIVGLTDIDSNGPPYLELLDETLLDRLFEPDATRPVAAFVHWGREYVAMPTQRETELAEAMRQRGATVIAGAHPHVASEDLSALAGGEAVLAYSLGNMIFDQSADRASGKLLELRVFDQGTVFVRLVDLPNLFDLARGKAP
jgi:AmmeMemoRadiSam system protein B